MIRRFVVAAVFAVFAAGQAQAGLLVLDFQGVTASGSLDPSGNPITPGTSFDLQATFDETPIPTNVPMVGTAGYSVTGITAVVGGTSYSAVLVPFSAFVFLFDPSSGLFGGSSYVPSLSDGATGDSFTPIYRAATPPTPPWSATAATPTVFSDYVTSPNFDLPIRTASGTLYLVYDPAVGVSASISAVSAVPEPSTISLAVLGSLAGAVLARHSWMPTPRSS